MRVDLAMVLDPIGQHCKNVSGVCEDLQPGVGAFRRFDELSDMPLLFGLRTGVNNILRPSARAKSAVSFAM